MARKKIVIALGGNALQESGMPPTAEMELEMAEKTAEHIADIIEMGYDVILSHGNGPQVGRVIQQNDCAAAVTPAMPFDVCGAMTQGMIGYHLQQGLSRVFQRRNLDRTAVTLITQVVVDPEDPRFQHPTKPIGRFYTREEAEQIQQDHPEQTFVEDAGRGWRRVVASPEPRDIVELQAIKRLMQAGFVIITVGGGGIPVVRSDAGRLEGVPAVIDKDLASALLAEELDADLLLILTGVEQVCINFNQPNQKRLDQLSVDRAQEYIAQGQFAPGSMLPKVEAAVHFTSSKAGRKTIITSLDRAAAALDGNVGTVIA